MILKPWMCFAAAGWFLLHFFLCLYPPLALVLSGAVFMLGMALLFKGLFLDKEDL
jgi:hypothetical protein